MDCSLLDRIPEGVLALVIVVMLAFRLIEKLIDGRKPKE